MDILPSDFWDYDLARKGKDIPYILLPIKGEPKRVRLDQDECMLPRAVAFISVHPWFDTNQCCGVRESRYCAVWGRREGRHVTYVHVSVHGYVDPNGEKVAIRSLTEEVRFMDVDDWSVPY